MIDLFICMSYCQEENFINSLSLGMETVPVREINNQNEAKPLNVYMAPKSKKLNGKNQYSWRKKRINIYNTQKKNCGQNLIY